jgi:hypothetical protein
MPVLRLDYFYGLFSLKFEDFLKMRREIWITRVTSTYVISILC